MDTLSKAIQRIDTHVGDPKTGIGEEVFHMVSRYTPMVNVDLLIKNREGAILLTWRDDQFYGPGWHLPGGVIRFKETFAERIQAVATSELNTQVSFSETPIMAQQVMNHSRDTRGHFISLLFTAELEAPLDDAQRYVPEKPKTNQWQWHLHMPDNLITVHKRIYRDLFPR